MHKKAELRERPLDAEERLRASMRSHFAKERCYISRFGTEWREWGKEEHARTRTSSRSERCTYTRSVAYDHALRSEREEREINR